MAVGYIVGGPCTGRYLTALPPRVLLMGQQGLSCLYTQNNDRNDLTSHSAGMRKRQERPERPHRAAVRALGWAGGQLDAEHLLQQASDRITIQHQCAVQITFVVHRSHSSSCPCRPESFRANLRRWNTKLRKA